MRDRSRRRTLAGLGAGVGLLATALTAGGLWLSRVAPADDDLRLLAAGLGLAVLIMALRCGRHARVD